MVEQHERLADDAGQETDRPVDALSALLEISETAHLKDLELWIWWV